MNKTFLFYLLAFFACGNSNQKAAIASSQTQREIIINPDSVAIKTLANEFDSVNTLVRDNKISKAQALEQLQRILPALQAAYKRLRPGETKREYLVFPVAGYTSKAIGGTHGEGYISNGYDYFDGNRHGGHPAQDIFIIDKNRDCKDDRNGKLVNVRSVTDGIAVASEKEWDNASPLRGGKYIWIYAPDENVLFYYAHNHEVFVNPGQMVNAGDTIATVGRTGLNAFKQKSPTHLHFMELTLGEDFYPKPVNPYQTLLKAETNYK